MIGRWTQNIEPLTIINSAQFIATLAYINSVNQFPFTNTLSSLYFKLFEFNILIVHWLSGRRVAEVLI